MKNSQSNELTPDCFTHVLRTPRDCDLPLLRGRLLRLHVEYTFRNSVSVAPPDKRYKFVQYENNHSHRIRL